MRCKNCGAPDPGHVCRYCRTRCGWRPPFEVETTYGTRIVGEQGPEPIVLRGRGAVDIDGAECW